MSRRPSREIRERVRAVFEDSPKQGYRPAELVEKVGLQANTVAMAAWDLIDAGELFISQDKKMKLTSREMLNASLLV